MEPNRLKLHLTRAPRVVKLSLLRIVQTAWVYNWQPSCFHQRNYLFFYNELIAEIWDLHLIPCSASVHILTFWSSTVAYTVARKWKAARRKYVVKIVCKVYFYDFYDKPRRHELTRSVHSNLSKLTMRCTLQRSKTRKIIACRGCKFFFVWESVSLAENVMSAKGENWRLK